MRLVALTGNDELFLVVALAIGLGTAAFTQAVGLSLALGAFLAGLIISNSDYAHETLARLLPIRDIFVALFFVTVGALIDPATILQNLPLLGAMLALIVIGKLLIWTGVVTVFGFPISTGLLVGVGLTQIGEFSFILVQVARTAGHVGDDVYNATLAASLISILVNALLVRYVPDWLGALRLRREAVHDLPAPEAFSASTHIVLCGFGRIGSAVGEALSTFGVPFTLIERDPDIVRDVRHRGEGAIFGDAGRSEVLAGAGGAQAALVIVALPDMAPAKRAVVATRVLNPGVAILARAHGREEAEQLRRAGATEVIQPELEAAATIIRHALAHLRLPEDQVLAYLKRFRQAIGSAVEGTAPAAVGLPEVREVLIVGGALVGRSLRESKIRERFGVTIVGIARTDEIMLNPPPETRLRDGDVVRVFGRPKEVAMFGEAAEHEG